MSHEEKIQFLLSRTKPVLKKTLFHMGMNAVVTFKSLEIYL